MDQKARSAVLKDIVQLRFRQAPVEEHADRAGPHAGELNIEIFDAVMSQNRHAIAPSDPAGLQIGGHGLDTLVELGIGEAPARRELPDRLPPAALKGMMGDPVIDPDRSVSDRTRGGHTRQL